MGLARRLQAALGATNGPIARVPGPKSGVLSSADPSFQPLPAPHAAFQPVDPAQDRRHRPRIDRPDAGHLDPVDGDVEPGRRPPGRADQPLHPGLRRSGARQYPLAGAVGGAAADGHDEDAGRLRTRRPTRRGCKSSRKPTGKIERGDLGRAQAHQRDHRRYQDAVGQCRAGADRHPHRDRRHRAAPRA